jgi:UDP:flavonoid glycosyltransferase YjiC (YdhE family)
VPFGDLMPHVAAYVTNGGYGGLHFALGHGVPMAVVGKTEDKAELVARVNWSGVGVGMRRQRAQSGWVRDAVRRILEEPRFRERAWAMQTELEDAGGPSRSADLLERLSTERAPLVGGASRRVLGSPRVAGQGAGPAAG